MKMVLFLYVSFVDANYSSLIYRFVNYAVCTVKFSRG